MSARRTAQLVSECHQELERWRVKTPAAAAAFIMVLAVHSGSPWTSQGLLCKDNGASTNHFRHANGRFELVTVTFFL